MNREDSGIFDFDYLFDRSAESDRTDNWPAEQIAFLADNDYLRWGLPAEYGGLEKSSTEMTDMYREMASACLLTTFILTQRNASCQRLACSDNETLKADLLPKFISGDLFTTVGISHLSTSRQHLRKPAVLAESTSEGFRLSGTIPWVTGGPAADWLLVGGMLESGEQLLALIETDASKVVVGQHARLMALTASHTGPVELHDVVVPHSQIVAGPAEQVMKSSSGGTGSVTTSALAVGVASRTIRLLKEEASRRSDLDEIVEPLSREYSQVNDEMMAFCNGETELNGNSVSTESIRQAANSLVLRASQAYLAATKGAGFVAGHAAERTIREAMFFLVWSCPQPVLSAAMREFACVN